MATATMSIEASPGQSEQAAQVGIVSHSSFYHNLFLSRHLGQHRVSECLVSALKWTIAQARLARRCIDSSAPDRRPNAARPDSSNNLVQRLRQGHMKLVVMWNAAYTLPSPHASIALLENGAAAFQQLASILVLLGRDLRSSHDTKSTFTLRIHLRHRQE
jgi:hypothetical protein